MPKLLKIRIISPHKTIYEGQAISISSTNSVGKFDILPEHANFITLITASPIIIRASGDKKTLEYSFPLAVIYAANDQVNIYTIPTSTP